jgi:hypothetical protein
VIILGAGGSTLDWIRCRYSPILDLNNEKLYGGLFSVKPAEKCCTSTYRYTTRQYKLLTTNKLRDLPTSVPEILGNKHGVFGGPNL